MDIVGCLDYFLSSWQSWKGLQTLDHIVPQDSGMHCQSRCDHHIICVETSMKEGVDLGGFSLIMQLERQQWLILYRCCKNISIIGEAKTDRFISSVLSNKTIVAKIGWEDLAGIARSKIGKQSQFGPAVVLHRPVKIEMFM